MNMGNRVHLLLENLNVLPELGRQRCFELGNPFYYQHSEDKNEPGNEKDTYYRKELPSGELYLVELEIVRGQGQTYQFNDTVIRRIR
jgi:hypothetical protein